MHCWIEMQSVLLEFEQFVALHRITDICRPPCINAFSRIASCCVALWNTRPVAFFNIVNRSSGIMLHCIDVELSYPTTTTTQHLLCCQHAVDCSENLSEANHQSIALNRHLLSWVADCSDRLAAPGPGFAQKFLRSSYRLSLSVGEFFWFYKHQHWAMFVIQEQVRARYKQVTLN